jgi:gamma-glutamyltranspeptidase/glutathione hydrolase
MGMVTDSAMVVSAHPLATAVGVSVLQQGGNAVDAAVAVHWALSVVAPWAGNIGGGGLLVIRDADGTVHTLDFRETAPAAASRDMYLDTAGHPINNLSLIGHRAVGVPGSVAGLFAVHDSLGRLPMARLIQPSIDLAIAGFPLTELEAHELNAKLASIQSASTKPNAYGAKSNWIAGDTLRLPELARTLERIRDGGSAEFYRGHTADLIVAEMLRGGGLIDHEDLAGYRPVWREPITGTYRDLEIISMGPPSSGGIVLIQALKAIEQANIRVSGWQKAATIHRMVEAERRAFADRAFLLGDPDFVRIPVDRLVSEDYVAERMADFQELRATPSSSVHAGDPLAESEHTTHFSIVDEEGNAVSCTTTLNGSYGSGVVVGRAGFVLNNEMDDFSIGCNTPNRYGLVGSTANAIEPGKRMLSSMAPTIVTKRGQLFMVLGSPGGATIPTSVLQTLVNVVDHGMTAKQAVTAPRFHHQWKPDTIRVEAKAISPEDSLALVRMGHRFKVRAPIGRVDAILVLPDGRLEAGSDPRGDDSAAGY